MQENFPRNQEIAMTPSRSWKVACKSVDADSPSYEVSHAEECSLGNLAEIEEKSD